MDLKGSAAAVIAAITLVSCTAQGGAPGGATTARRDFPVPTEAFVESVSTEKGTEGLTDIPTETESAPGESSVTEKAAETDPVPATETTSKPTGKATETDPVPATETTAEPEEQTAFRDMSPLSVEYYMTPVENYSFERDRDIEFVMIHFSSNVKAKPTDPYVVDDIKDIYLKSEVSTNYVIDREGKIYCFMPEYRCAWHAGVGTWKNDSRLKDRMNRYSIGIELLAMGSESEMLRYITAEQYAALDEGLIGYTDAQYEALGALLSDICGTYGIPRDRDHVIGHQEYATKKPDPGELFDWSRIIN